MMGTQMMAFQWRTMVKNQNCLATRGTVQAHALLLTEQKINPSQLDKVASGRDKHTESETRKTANPKTHLTHIYNTGEGTIQATVP